MKTFSTHDQPKEPLSRNKFSNELYQCQFCRGYFTPKKRFVQKYCSESCRVMACRERNKGKNPPQPQENKKNSGFQKNFQPKTGGDNGTTTLSPEILKELTRIMDERDKKLMREIRSIQSNQEIHMLISSLAPFVAEPVRKKLVEKRNSNTTPGNLTEVLQILEPTLNGLPPELKIHLSQAASGFYKDKK